MIDNLIEKLKTILPSTKNIVFSRVLLFIFSCLLSLNFINTFTTTKTIFTILLCLGGGFVIFSFYELYIFCMQKQLKADINLPHYNVIFNTLFACEVFIIAIIFLLAILISPIVFIVVAILTLLLITWFNIIFEFKFFTPLIGNKEKTLNTLKFINVCITSLLLLIWVIF